MSTIESSIVASPAWWLSKLERRLSQRQSDMALMENYYCGEHPLPFLTPAHRAKMWNEFRKMLDQSRSNFMRLVVDVVEERLRVEGFRLSASSDASSDKASWDIWQANQMDSQSQIAFVDALVKGVSYISVWAGEEHPTMAIEDARQTIVGYVPGSNYTQRASALKIWIDDVSGFERANVYLPGGIYKFVRVASDESPPATLSAKGDNFEESKSPVIRSSSDARATTWKEIVSERVDNPLGIVPIVPLRNRPRLTKEGESELSDVVYVQDQINGFLFLLALAGYFGAHRQRWATGMPIMETTDGKLKEPFDVAIDRLWQSEDPATKFGEFEQTQLEGYIRAIEQKILHIAVTTRTPRHYLIEQGQSPSGDAIKSAESGLVKKVERKQRPFGEGLEEAIRLARRFAGETDAPVDSEIVWADAEIRSEAETTDAAIKKLQVGLIDRAQALEDCGYSQVQIARMLAEDLAPLPTNGPVPVTP